MYVFKNILTTAKNKETSFKKSVHEKEVSNFNFLTGNLKNTNTFLVHRSDIGRRSLWSDWKRALKRGKSGQEVPIPPQSYKTSESVLFREHDGEERENPGSSKMRHLSSPPPGWIGRSDEWGKRGKNRFDSKGRWEKERRRWTHTEKERERARSGSPNSPRAVAADRVAPATPTAPGWRKHRQICEREKEKTIIHQQ